jgi:hypothetical protein
MSLLTKGTHKSIEHWHQNRQPCFFCSKHTGYLDRVCSGCRSKVPLHIPFEQVRRYVRVYNERINAKCNI